MTCPDTYHTSAVASDDLVIGRKHPNWIAWGLADAFGEVTAAQQFHMADEALIGAEDALTALEDIPESGPVGVARAAASAIIAYWDSAPSVAPWSQELQLRCEELIAALRRIYAEIRPIPAMLDIEPKPQRKARTAKHARSEAAAIPLDALPLFAPDTLLGKALLGRDRVKEWKQLAPLLEARGLPKVDQMMGGRFVPAVLAFFKHQYGLGASTAFAPDGVEDFETWKRNPKHRG